MSSDAGMVIIGAGEAGARAAAALRENQYSGPITLIGEERHLPYERPPLSKAAMTAIDEPGAATIMTEAQLAAHGIRHLSGVMVTDIDRMGHTVLLDDGSRVSYGKLLLATGARPRKLTTPGADARVGALPPHLQRCARDAGLPQARHPARGDRWRLHRPRNCGQRPRPWMLSDRRRDGAAHPRPRRARRGGRVVVAAAHAAAGIRQIVGHRHRRYRSRLRRARRRHPPCL